MSVVRMFIAGLVLSLSTAAQADVIDFGSNSCTFTCVNGSFTAQEFGDISGVMDVSYVAANGSGLRFWDGGYSGLSGVAYVDSGQSGRITFATNPGYRITMRGFQLGAWQGVDRQTSYRIYNTKGKLLFDSGLITVPGAGLAVQGRWGSKNGVVLDLGPDFYNVGLDQIRYRLSTYTINPLAAPARAKFGPPAPQPLPPVPVPASLPLLAGAVAMLALLRRRFARG